MFPVDFPKLRERAVQTRFYVRERQPQPLGDLGKRQVERVAQRENFADLFGLFLQRLVYLPHEQRALGGVIKKIQSSHRAFPLRELANLFCNNPASCQIRIEPNKGETMQLFQCACCGAPALSEEELIQHLCSCHLQDYFEAVETTCEPPTGQFVCVARCGLSGVLLGPPNHHSFTAKVHEVLRTRYPGMSESEYRSRIEMVKEPEVIEQWRQECTKKTLFRAKKPDAPKAEEAPAAEGEAPATESAEEAAPLVEREVAENIFLREIVPGLITSVRRVLCPLPAALKTPNRRLRSTLEHVVDYERRNRPMSILGALRGAFRSRKLYLFRANHEQGQEFVQLFHPVPLEAGHAVKELCDIATFVDEHPGCTKQELVQALAGDDTEKAKQTLVQLNLLVAKGHVVYFFNDTLAAPCEHPFFQHKAPPKPAAPVASSEEKAETVAETPAAETPSTETAATETPAEATPPEAPAAETEAAPAETAVAETESAEAAPTPEVPAE